MSHNRFFKTSLTTDQPAEKPATKAESQTNTENHPPEIIAAMEAIKKMDPSIEVKAFRVSDDEDANGLGSVKSLDELLAAVKERVEKAKSAPVKNCGCLAHYEALSEPTKLEACMDIMARSLPNAIAAAIHERAKAMSLSGVAGVTDVVQGEHGRGEFAKVLASQMAVDVMLMSMFESLNDMAAHGEPITLPDAEKFFKHQVAAIMTFLLIDMAKGPAVTH